MRGAMARSCPLRWCVRPHSLKLHIFTAPATGQHFDPSRAASASMIVRAKDSLISSIKMSETPCGIGWQWREREGYRGESVRRRLTSELLVDRPQGRVRLDSERASMACDPALLADSRRAHLAHRGVRNRVLALLRQVLRERLVHCPSDEQARTEERCGPV